MTRVLLGVLGCLTGACASAAPLPVPQHGAPVERPVPPSDLDARLIQSYPLRGRVLGESGFARVAFTVQPSGAVTTQAVLKASQPAYAAACQSMLQTTTWSPARDAAGSAVEYSSTFDCMFEHPTDAASRTTLAVATHPPTSPQYGDHWFERFGGSYVGHNTGAELRIEVHTDGRVSVRGMMPGSDPEVARACQRMLEEGPLWQPATDAKGNAVDYEGPFTCRVNLETQHKEMALADVAAAGPLPVEQIAATVTAHLTAFSHCFESAFGMSKKIHGLHWLAFEVLPSGALGRIEWVERPLDDELLEACVFSAVRELRFAPATLPTLADIRLEVGGRAKLQHSL